jgi:hypothetical protein
MSSNTFPPTVIRRPITAVQAARDLAQYRAEIAAQEQQLLEQFAQQDTGQQPPQTPDDIEMARARQLDELRAGAAELERRADELREPGTPTLAEMRAAEESRVNQAAVQGYAQAVQAGRLQASGNMAALLRAHAQEFPEVKSAADVQAMQQRDPAKFARWQQMDSAYRQEEARAQHAERQIQQLAVAHQQQQQQATHQWIEAQDKLADTKIPELSGPNAQHQLQLKNTAPSKPLGTLLEREDPRQ